MSNHLHTLSQSNTSVESLSQYYDALDHDITKALLHAEQHSAKASYGSPWSPTLVHKGRELIFWKHTCSGFCQYADSLASIPDISILVSCPVHTTIIKNRYSLSYSLNCLHAACYLLEECHVVAAQLHCNHLTEHACHATSTSNTSAETALNNILKAEVAIATFCKLKKYAKGETHSFLQQVDIPVLDSNLNPTGQTSSITELTNLFATITAQNISHFSQAMDTPGI